MLRRARASSVGPWLLLLCALPARAELPAELALPRLDWRAPRECPDADAVSARLAEVLDGEVLDGELLAFAHDWQIRGAISADGASAWRLVLELSEPGTTRRTDGRQRVLRAARCDELADAAAVAIAIALGDAMEPDLGTAPPEDRAAPPPRARAGAAASPPPELSEKDSAPGASDAARTQPSVHLDLALGALLDSATLGDWSVGGSASARGWIDRLGLGFHGVWLPPSTRTIAPGQGAELSLLGAGVRACYAPLDARLRLATCAGIELGRFGANGRGLVEAERLHDFWLAPSVSADVQGRVLGDLGLSSRLELLLPLERREYRVDLDQPVHDTPRLTFRWAIGVSTDFML